ncbi:uncharacterized protein METZ01_LOCUS205884 [marine metagenome]|uniref:Uncharacterized protein n=1 Tax=marine metagenome TaxID=408172 RepID=A0A382EQL2_9ZZZZ
MVFIYGINNQIKTYQHFQSGMLQYFINS